MGSNGKARRWWATGLAVALSLVLMFPIAAHAKGKDCTQTSVGLTPLTDMGDSLYQSYEGGLYPNASNDIPETHLALGMRLSSQVVPRDAAGNPDPNGAIGFVSIGVSNTRAEFTRFMEVAATDSELNPALAIFNGAQGSRALGEWAESAEANPWRNVSLDLEKAGIAQLQVQAAWIMLPDKSRGTVDLALADGEIDDMTTVLQHLKANYPNVMVAYVSSRMYAGYSPDGEPKAYQHGFAIKWLIERQIGGEPELNADDAAGPVVTPWVGWGPYTWADGMNGRSDGLVWECEDFRGDGIHPEAGASDKIASMLLDHLKTSPTSSAWFVGSTSIPSTTVQTTSTTTTTTAPTTTGSSQTTIQPATTTAPTVTQPLAPDENGSDDGSGVRWLVGGAVLGLVASVGIWRLYMGPPVEDREP